MPRAIALLLLFSAAAAASPPSSSSPPPEVVRLSPDVSWLYSRALPELKAKSYGEVISDCTKALGLTRDPRALSIFLSMRAAAYIADQQYELALKDAKEARRLFPDNAWAWNGCARAENALSLFDAAIVDASRAIQLNPKYGSAYSERGFARHSQGHYAASIPDYRRGLELDSSIENLAENLAMAEAQAGKTGEGIADLKRAIASKSPDGLAYATLASVYFRKGDYEHAASAIQRAFELKPNDERVLNEMAWIKATCPVASFRNGAEAEKLAKRACDRTHWKNPQTIDTWAAANAELGDFNRAIGAERKALQFPNLPPKGRSSLEEHLHLFEQRHPVRDKP